MMNTTILKDIDTRFKSDAHAAHLVLTLAPKSYASVIPADYYVEPGEINTLRYGHQNITVINHGNAYSIKFLETRNNNNNGDEYVITMRVHAPIVLFRHTHVTSNISKLPFYNREKRRTDLTHICIDGRYDEYGIDIFTFDVKNCTYVVGLCPQSLLLWSCAKDMFRRKMINNNTQSVMTFVGTMERFMLEQYAR